MPIKKLKDHIASITRKDWKAHSRGIIFNNELNKFSKAFRTNLITLLISAFGLVAALTWQEAIKEAINVFFPQQSILVYKLYIAIVVSVMAVIVTYFFSRLKGEG
jgi:hypothetical protein